METPIHYEIVGDSLALKWADGSEDIWKSSFLRKQSPSAEEAGEMDIFGRIIGGQSADQNYHDILLRDCKPVGNYGLRLIFSDGHATGIYSWKYLKDLNEKLEDSEREEN